jgi:GWxTD domain-containing protein
VIKRGIFIVCAAVAGLLIVWSDATAQKTQLPAQHKKWLEEEVVYIIAPLEKEVFLKLRSDRERDLFIEAFWKQRDPTPNTPENEFRTEHYRRINYANHFYGRSAPLPGWKTDRGRVYIKLGEPNDVQRFEGHGGVYPSEIWFYQDKASLGLPPGFHVVFFQEGGQGDYKIYSPSKDGPQALLVSYFGDPVDYQAAYESLREIEPTLADVSLSLIPGEDSGALGRPSLASDMLIQKVENAPQMQIDERYAQKFHDYKDLVEVEYTANYLDSNSMVKVVKDPSGIYFVHYAVEPKRLSVDAYENKYSTSLKVNGRVATLDGKMIYQFEKPVMLSMDEAQMKEADRQPFDLHDMFPLIPGTYKLSILVKNEVSKEFTSLEQTLFIPGESPALQMTSPILGFKTGRADSAKKRLKPFQVGALQVYCQPNRVFTKRDTMAVVFQVFGLSSQQRQSGLIRFVFSRNNQTVLEKNRPVAEVAEFPNVLEEFPMADFIPAHYMLKVSILADGRELVTGTEEFDVSHQEAIPRPWFYSKLMPETTDPLYAQIIGGQLFNSGRVEEAKGHLERAYKQRPDSAEAALGLAQIYMALGEHGSVPAILSPFLSPPQKPDYEIYFLAGQAHQKLGNFAMAIEIFDQAVSHFGINMNLLNAIGECYAQWGRPKEALAAWEKSLAIHPNQPDIKKKVDALKEKK